MIWGVFLNVQIPLRHQSRPNQRALDHLPAVKIPVAVSIARSRQGGGYRAVTPRARIPEFQHGGFEPILIGIGCAFAQPIFRLSGQRAAFQGG